MNIKRYFPLSRAQRLELIEIVKPYYQLYHTHYHTWDHVMNCLYAGPFFINNGIYLNGLQTRDRIKAPDGVGHYILQMETTWFTDAEFLALLFHDCVYYVHEELQFGMNEKLSARVMHHIMSVYMGYDRVVNAPQEVKDAELLIKATAMYTQPYDFVVSTLSANSSPSLIDSIRKVMSIDLMSFAAETYDSRQMNDDIVDEFRFLNEERFWIGRKKFLTDMLEKKYIFPISHSSEAGLLWDHKKWDAAETQARRNITRLLTECDTASFN